MPIISEIRSKYSNKVDHIDIDLIVAHILGCSREFVLTHPEIKLTQNRSAKIEQLLERRRKHEPTAYLIGHKEFYGLDFTIDSSTLIPRPETELLVEKSLQLLENNNGKKISVIDVGTGSGNIITSIAKNAKDERINYFGIDISKEALGIAKRNAKKHNLAKIRFIKSNLLSYYLENDKITKRFDHLIILANLPYLSDKIYRATAPDIKNFEPKSALYSPKAGLEHYEKLLKQLNLLAARCPLLTVHCFLEFSPEQKRALEIRIKKILPRSGCVFTKDLAGKWRVCQIKLTS